MWNLTILILNKSYIIRVYGWRIKGIFVSLRHLSPKSLSPNYYAVKDDFLNLKNKNVLI